MQLRADFAQAGSTIAADAADSCAAADERQLTVWCETDIFQALGLSYVPPFMRHFHDVSS
jgi:hypothetical protein